MLGNKQSYNTYLLLCAAVFALIFLFVQKGVGQTNSAGRYLDSQGGMTADGAVGVALENNGEIQALRKETEAARAMVKQAGLRPNPTLSASGAKQIGGADNNQMAEVILPLELGGRQMGRAHV